MPVDFSTTQIVLTAILFIWTGFVRTGIGFGGAALGLPVLLLVHEQALFWLPIIGAHLLFFSGLTLGTRLRDVDWGYLRRSSVWILPSALVGVFGLLNLPNDWLLVFIYTVTLFYAFIWVMNWAILSRSDAFDKLLLVIGGYVAGTSLTGAPFMVAVYMRHVAKQRLRNTLFVLWFVLVTFKMSAFVAVGVDLNLLTALMLLPVAAIGHVIGLKVHDRLMRDDATFRRVIGGVLIVISAIGLWRV